VEARTGTFDVSVVVGNLNEAKKLLHCLKTAAIIDKVQSSRRCESLLLLGR
jgi:hypothetical protein